VWLGLVVAEMRVTGTEGDWDWGGWDEGGWAEGGCD